MTSLISRDVRPTYVPPGNVMYLRDDGPLVPIEGDEEEESSDEEERKKESGRSKGSNEVNRGENERGGARPTTNNQKRGSDSAYSSTVFGGERGERGRAMGDNEDCASTASTVPLDPSTHVPVFLVPSEMEFVVAGDSPDTRKILTLYNPYDYNFQYRILCTAPEHYALQRPSGVVGAKRVVEISIRGLPSLVPSMMHRIRVEIRRIGQTELLGARQIFMRSVAFATPGEGGREGTGGVFHRMGGMPTEEGGGGRGGERGSRGGGGGGGGETQRGARPASTPDVRIVNEPAASPVNLSLMMVISALCLLALCLPIQKEMTASSTMIPSSLHISETQRVVAAFILGVCSVLILQPAQNR